VIEEGICAEVIAEVCTRRTVEVTSSTLWYYKFSAGEMLEDIMAKMARMAQYLLNQGQLHLAQRPLQCRLGPHPEPCLAFAASYDCMADASFQILLRQLPNLSRTVVEGIER